MIFEGAFLGKPEGDFSAISIDALNVNLTIRNVTIEGFYSGIALRGTICTTCTITLENVTMQGSGVPGDFLMPWEAPVGVFAMRDPTYGIPSLIGKNLTIHGFQTGLMWQTNDDQEKDSVYLSDVLISCMERGILLGVDVVEIRELTVSDCNGVGLRAGSYSRFSLSAGDFRSNWQGLVLWGRIASQTEVSASVFVDNEVGGALFGSGEGFTLRDSAFSGNGAAPNQSQYDGLEADVVHAVFQNDGKLTMRHNCIEGNLGWGAVSPFAAAAIDAQQNWWGSSDGPRIGGNPESGYKPPMTVAPGEGDVVSLRTNFRPFLSEAPSSCGLLEPDADTLAPSHTIYSHPTTLGGAWSAGQDSRFS